ncbi:CDP-alcohol phosphatidyltransferase family protein [Halovenus salina]|uniref:CDP-alcohol phosphatidyltransferase family protein n=1 Tax=Halovenus salina TaxID=1510225 RepID=A0ABD5VV95_9EURY
MSLRVVDRLGVADVITLANAVVGVGAMVGAVLGEPMLVAQLLLLGAAADALDGILARSFGEALLAHSSTRWPTSSRSARRPGCLFLPLQRRSGGH